MEGVMALKFLSPIHKSSRQVGLYLEGRMGKLGLTNTEGHVMSYMRAYAPRSIGELHQVFGYKRSTLTSLFGRLDGRGFVTREIDPGDRRSIIVRLTRKGSAVADRINGEVEKLEGAIRRRVSGTDMAGFRAVMEAIEGATAITIRGGQRR